jgi:hypothetical protein
MVQLSPFVCIGLINLLIWLIADFIYVQLGQQSSHCCFDYLLLISQYLFWLWGTTTLFKHFSFCKKWLLRMVLACILWFFCLLLTGALVLFVHVYMIKAAL